MSQKIGSSRASFNMSEPSGYGIIWYLSGSLSQRDLRETGRGEENECSNRGAVESSNKKE